MFIDFVDHNILLKKLEINGIVGKNLKWFKNYLNNRKQYIQINNEEKMWCNIGVYSKTSFFLIYINDLQFISDVLDPIMFAYDTCFTRTKTLMLCFSK